MRETPVLLDNMDALTKGIMAAVADKHHLVKVRISQTLHNLISLESCHEEVEADSILRDFRNYYDAGSKAGILHTELSGCLYGADVFIDGHLEGHRLVIVSAPYPTH